MTMIANNSEQTTDTAAVLFGIVVQLTFERDLARKERDEAREQLSLTSSQTRWRVADLEQQATKLLAREGVLSRERHDAINALDDARKERDVALENDWPSCSHRSDIGELLGWVGKDLSSKTIDTITQVRITYSDPATFGLVEIFFATTWHQVNDCTVRKP